MKRKMTKKDELLKEAIDEVVMMKSTLDGEPGGRTEDEVCLWTIERCGKDQELISIILHYFDWCEEHQCWIDNDISELEGPALLNCPVRMLQYPVSNELIFPEWRYEVKKYHEGLGNLVQEGDIAIRLMESIPKRGNK